MISAVVFDAFGTLLNVNVNVNVNVKSKRHPFRQLLKEGIAAGRRPSNWEFQEASWTGSQEGYSSALLGRLPGDR
ncbi:hypothetical protein OKW98_15485 [Pseudomonas sp. KU26590]|uniref:hypothetical protein n=1 Tax=Pseudomonas sp. KU26590 TaxID=2991051 RepID=UPI00223CA4B9|nr:hypothetical protein [Pseudomonas sp. KU26590]UZJ62940.1 hypothetical protein OKW98_15485 [Pseudomonas sp. KU26590]